MRARRITRGMKQDVLASKVGVAQSTLSGIENGSQTPGVNVAIRIARVLKCKVEDIFIEPDGWMEW